jgi:hypothetical protein
LVITFGSVKARGHPSAQWTHLILDPYRLISINGGACMQVLTALPELIKVTIDISSSGS